MYFNNADYANHQAYHKITETKVIKSDNLTDEQKAEYKEIKADSEALKAKIDELLADENMGEAEKAKLNEYKAQADKLIGIINTPKENLPLRFFCLFRDCITRKHNGVIWIFSKNSGC
ncbi:MAG: hypothetical protein IJD78_08125 [Clostridia bacterium]|nr:hypothetical protein [Clostridia bacterium]